MPWPDPFHLIPVGLLPIPTGYEFAFRPVPAVMITAGLILGLVRQYRGKSSLKGLLSACLLFLISGTLTMAVADRYTRSYERNVGCSDAGKDGFVVPVPLFAQPSYRPYLPDGTRFDGLLCREFADKMWQSAPLGTISTLLLIGFGLGVICLAVGMIFAWIYMPVASLGRTLKAAAKARSPKATAFKTRK